MRRTLILVSVLISGCASHPGSSVAEAEQQAYDLTKARYDGQNRAENEHWMSLLPNAGITPDTSPTDRAARIETGLKAQTDAQIAKMKESMSRQTPAPPPESAPPGSPP